VTNLRIGLIWVVVGMILCGSLVWLPTQTVYTNSKPVEVESVKATYYETYLRCYNCSADGDSFANTRVKVRIPVGQSIMDPKSICPKCKVPFSVGR
jgi:hypothetical protein